MAEPVISQAPSIANNPPVGTQQQPPPVNEIIDLDSVPGQIGHAVLRVSDGTIIRRPTGSLSERDVGIVYRMMLEIGTVLEGEGLQRVTVGFRSVSYAVALGDGCLYIVKKRSSS